jgi:putative oxidoreductase
MQHGLQKLFGFFGGVPPSGEAVPLISLMGAAGLIETIGGVLIVVGFLTRPVAAVLVAEMVVAYFMAHFPQGGWPIQNQGELALLYASIFVFLAGHGAGPLSLDAWVPAPTMHDRRHAPERRHRVAA